MNLNLKYYKASAYRKGSKPKDYYRQDNDAIIDDGFDNTYNVYYDEIEYEQTYGENDFAPISRVRVDSVLQYNTGIILGDDYKVFMFAPEFELKPKYGMKFKWNDDYWLVINTNHFASMTNIVEVRRCNNILRFFDDNGGKVYEPCIMDYTLRFANNNDVSPITVGNGEQKIWCQRNYRTETIKANDRFLFGTVNQRVSFRVYAGGIKNYTNTITGDDNSPNLTEFYVEHYEINEEYDDLVNGFANAFIEEINAKIINNITSVKKGDVVTLEANLYRGENVVTPSLEFDWVSDNEEVATIVGNQLYAINDGTVNITVMYNGQENISDSVQVTVVNDIVENQYSIILDDDNEEIFEGEVRIMRGTLCVNGVPQNDTVYFNNVTTNVPIPNYKFHNLSDNRFELTNIERYPYGYVIISCESRGFITQFNFILKGVY